MNQIALRYVFSALRYVIQFGIIPKYLNKYNYLVYTGYRISIINKDDITH